MTLTLARSFRLVRNSIFALAAIALAGSSALAQQTPTPPDTPAPPAAPIERQPPSDKMGPGPMHPGMMQDRRNGHPDFRDHGDMREGRGGPMAADFHIAPPGMWWKNPMVVQRLTLTPEQVKKMDDIFQKSRLQLIDLKASVEKQQVLLEPMLSANPLDSTKAMVQIDKVAQSRADLEKAHARMLLGIRTVLTPDQWTKLNDRHRPGGFGPPAGPDAPGTPGQPAGLGGARTHGMRGGGPTATTSNLVGPIDKP